MKTRANGRPARGQRSGERGSATIPALVVALALIGLSGAVLTMSLSTEREQSASGDRQEALYCANSGVANAVVNLYAGDMVAAAAPGEIGGGGYDAAVVDNGDDTFTVTSSGAVRGQEQTVEAIVERSGGGVFDNALFAGNSSDDPLYALELGGDGNQADLVLGDVYSGGDVDVTGDASVNGTIRASGVINGASGEGGVSQPILDLQAMDYANTADYDVLDLFVEDPSLTYTYDGAGGYAYQVPPSNPAHIFRANPSDRSSEYQSTTKNDFFLEDPYEAVRSDPDQDGSDPYEISLSDGGNRRVYYVDGNLWLHNKKSFSFAFEEEPNGVQATFVVEGNIYFSDNLFYGDEDLDGLAFIALEDPDVADTGNIYFGDSVFGTLVSMSAYMYAENNFYDQNLDASGSTTVTVNGIMSAGNHVEIERDYGDEHTRLVVNYDERVAEGSLELPGLPQSEGGGDVAYDVVSWRVVANP